MTEHSEKWTRRQFSQVFAAASASTLLMRKASASLPARRDGFAFIHSSGTDPADGMIRVYRVTGDDWQEVHAVSSISPAHMIMHPTTSVMYAIHNVAEWDLRPRGAVSAYRFDSAKGQLRHVGSQPLSLSATNPRSAVVTADGHTLFVAAESGGIYNALPIAADGTLQPVSAIRKEFGLQDGGVAKTAAPRQVELHADGGIYAADPGQETVSRFIVSRSEITLQHRTRVHAGAGAAQIALSKFGQLYSMRAGGGLVHVQNVTEQGMSHSPQICSEAGNTRSMQMHPDGQLLAVSSDDSLKILRVLSRSGYLHVQEDVRQAPLQHLRFNASGTQLVGIEVASGKVIAYAIDPGSGKLSSPRVVAQAHPSSSLLFHQA